MKVKSLGRRLRDLTTNLNHLFSNTIKILLQRDMYILGTPLLDTTTKLRLRQDSSTTNYG